MLKFKLLEKIDVCVGDLFYFNVQTILIQESYILARIIPLRGGLLSYFFFASASNPSPLIMYALSARVAFRSARARAAARSAGHK